MPDKFIYRLFSEHCLRRTSLEDINVLLLHPYIIQIKLWNYPFKSDFCFKTTLQSSYWHILKLHNQSNLSTAWQTKEQNICCTMNSGGLTNLYTQLFLLYLCLLWYILRWLLRELSVRNTLLHRLHTALFNGCRCCCSLCLFSVNLVLSNFPQWSHLWQAVSGSDANRSGCSDWVQAKHREQTTPH